MHGEFIQAIEKYWSDYSFDIPQDTSLCQLVPSSHGYVDQRVVNRNLSHQHDRQGDLSRFISKVSRLHGNLNYKRSVKEWKKFYTFPDEADAIKYAYEQKAHVTKIVNFNEKAPSSLTNEVKRAFEIGDHQVARIQFLRGTTGVGKTTFLKYFSKVYREELFLSGIVVTRVRFRDIQDYHKESESKQFSNSFRQVLVNCLVRDLCASAAFKYDETQENAKQLQTKIDDGIASILLELEQLSGYSVDEAIDEFEKDEDFLQELPDKDKCNFILKLKDDLNFCIILDGFDAMRPEEIALFQDASEGEFLECLSTVIRNAFSRTSSTGACLKKINKYFLIAARNITITQLRDLIEGETDNNHEVLPDLHVIGTSMTKLLMNRIEVYFAGDVPRAKMKKLQEGIILSIDYIMALLRKEHITIEPGRFIDLFNHNIREKVRFLADFIDLLTFKVEVKHRTDNASLPAHARPKLGIDDFIDYVSSTRSGLGLDVYEVQKLLILNKDGYFRNFFHHNTDNQLIPESNRGQFDNLFNYENRKLFGVEGEDPETDYSFSKDPLLEKFLILFRLSKEEELPQPVLEAWYQDNFIFQRCRGTTLRQLIRSGLIMADYVDDVIHFRLTRKGRFVYEDLMGVSVYLEHVVLNCHVPHFISRKIIRPADGSRRSWGRNSVSNVAIFLKYVQSVAKYSIKPGRDQLRTEIMEKIDSGMMRSVLDSFRGIIAEGLENEIMRDYATDLKAEMRRVGVVIK